MSAWIGTLWALGSALSWAAANAAIQGATRGAGSFSALVYTQLLGGAIAVVFAFFHDGPLGLPAAGAWLALACGGLASAAAYVGLFEALRRGQVAVVSPIASAWSTVSVAIGMARGERPTSVALAGVALVIGGNVVVARAAALDRSRQTPGAALLFAVLAAVGFGVLVHLLDVAGATVGRLWAIPLVWLHELAFGVPILLALGLLRRPRRPALRALGAAGVFEVGGFICLSLGLAVAPVSLVSPVSSLSTMGSVAIGVLFLGERVGRVALAGAALASTGVVLVNL